jgi:hypothetical protein
MTLAVGYTRKASGGRARGAVTLLRRVERVRTGTTTVSIVLSAHTAQMLAAHRPLRLSVSLAPAG